jgi:hypothetical protein
MQKQFVLFFVVLFIGLIAGCIKSEDQSFSMSELLETKKPIGLIDIKDNIYEVTANESAITKDENIIKEFSAIINNYELQKVVKEENSDLWTKMDAYRNEGESLSIFLENEDSELAMNALSIDIAKDGFAFVVDFKNGKGETFYKIIDSTPELYSNIYNFYDDIYKIED